MTIPRVIYYMYVSGVLFCFFKRKTAYEMRISDWSSDVCSSDLENCGYRTGPRGVSRYRACAHRLAGTNPRGRVDEAEARPFNHRVLEIGSESCRERVCQYV